MELLPSVSIPLNIVLHDNQQLVHESKALNKVVKAGKRFGKTKWLLYALVKACFRRPKQVIWYLAPSYKQAKNIAWSELNWLLPKKIVRRSLENELTKEFINDSVLKLVGTDNEDSVRGVKLHGAGFDEAAYIDPYIYEAIISGQLMGGKEEGMGFSYFISSPNKTGRNWFSNFWDDAKAKMDSGDKNWGAWYFSIYDNPTLNREDIEKLRSNTTDDTWQLEYMAKESTHAGQIYSEFSYANHVKETEVGGVQVRGLDWGISHPTACVWAKVNPETKRVHIFQEFMRSGLVIDESCRAITQMTKGDVAWSVIDPSTAKRNSQTNRRDMDEFNRAGVLVMPGDNRDRGYDITKMFFKKNLITIDPKCKNLILQLKNLQYGDKENDDMCLIAGTKIACEDGLKNIEDVKVGDMVLTRGGYQKVRMSERTNCTDVIQIKTSNGKEIVGTLNHPIFMCDGSLKELGKLEVGEKLFDIRYSYLIQCGIWKLKSLLKPVKNLTELGSTRWAVSIFKDVSMMEERLSCCIVKYGSIITAEFLKVSRFITKTITEITTKFQIYKPCHSPNICGFTWERQSAKSERERSCLMSFTSTPQSGMEAKKVLNFTNGLLNCLGKKENGLRRIARFAVESTKHLFQCVLNFAILIADSVTFRDVKVTSATRLPTKHFVYNLSVENHNEYIANGLLSHNTDCLRYMCVRIHDILFNRIFDTEKKPEDSPFKARPYNFNDKLLFPQQQKERAGIIEEIGRY